MEKSVKFLNLVLALIFVLQRNVNVQSATLDKNGYTLDIAISNQVNRIPQEERLHFLQILQVSHVSPKRFFFLL